jgi:hypothetical protein
MENVSGNKDYLNFKKESSLKKLIGDEELLFSDKIIKINRYGLSQERNIIITNKAIYNLKKKGNKNIFNKIIIFYNYSFKKTYSFKYYIRDNSEQINRRIYYSWN